MVLVPDSLRKQMLTLLHHKCYLGISKTLEWARLSVFWPGVTVNIKNAISACKSCLTFSDKQQKEPVISDPVTTPWTHLSLDNFDFQGQHFLMVLDTATKCFIVHSVH